MKLTELQPDSVYAVRSNDYASASSRYGDWVYVRTGSPVRIEQKASRTGKLTMVELLPLAETPIVGDNERYARGGFGPAYGYGTVPEPTLRRGLSIGNRVCSVEEWPAYRATKIAAQLEAREAKALWDRQYRHAQERLRAACDTLGLHADDRWAQALLQSKDYGDIMDMLEDAAKEY